MDQSDARLEVSVSFGRFENDALSWEKWSSFSPNKYLEEVGSLSTPGSVAQKKAYFEAHYKKIAAQKAQALEQEKEDVPNKEAPPSEFSNGSAASNGANLVEEPAEESCLTEDGEVVSVAGSESGACDTASVMQALASEEEMLSSSVAVNDGSSAVEENVMGSDLDVVESCRKDDHGSAEVVLEKQIAVKKEKLKLSSAGNASPKVITQTKKERFLSGTRKKQSPASRNSAPPSAPQSLEKPQTPQSKTKNYSSVGDKKEVSPTSLHLSMNSGPAKSKNSLVGDKKGVASTSLHVSMNSGPAKSKNSLVGGKKVVAPASLYKSMNSGPVHSSSGVSMMRKPLIMDKLGDKDFVRRAFKSFQKPSPIKHESSGAVEPKFSSFRTPIKMHERPKRDSEKRTIPTLRTPSGARSNPLPSGSHKVSPPDKKYSPGYSSGSLPNARKVEQRKEFLKKLEANSIARAAENAHHARTSKDGVES